jgi:hypothetical protein
VRIQQTLSACEPLGPPRATQQCESHSAEKQTKEASQSGIQAQTGKTTAHSNQLLAAELYLPALGCSSSSEQNQSKGKVAQIGALELQSLAAVAASDSTIRRYTIHLQFVSTV